MNNNNIAFVVRKCPVYSTHYSPMRVFVGENAEARANAWMKEQEEKDKKNILHSIWDVDEVPCGE